MRNLIIFLATLAATQVVAQVPTWSVDPTAYSNSMVVVGVINASSVESTDENDLVAAFVGGQVRGVANVKYEAVADRYLVYLLVYSNTSGGTITFKLYDADQDIEFDAQNTAVFATNSIIGDVGNPYVISDILLNDATDLLTFSFPENDSPSTIETSAVMVNVASGTDVSALVADFTTADGATVWVGGDRQASGVTSNDFSSAITYTIISEDGDNQRSFDVNVTAINNPPSDIGLTVANIEENNSANAIVGALTVSDDGSAHTFSFVSGEGSEDNDFFEIVAGEIQAITSFDFEVKNSYSIRLMVTDDADQTFEKSLTITVTDVNEAPSDIQLSKESIAENEPSGTVFAVLSSTDPDNAETFTYALTGGLADNASFSLNEDALITASTFDFEAQSSFTIELMVTDGGGNTHVETFALTISNQNDAPTAVTMDSQEVFENLPFGTVIGTLSASDQDVGDVQLYSLVSGDGDTNNTSVLISGSQVLVNETLDFETQSELSIRLEVRDQNSASHEETFLISVLDANDSPTDLLLSNTLVMENSDVGSLVGQLSVVDTDPTTTTYEFVTGQNHNDHFALDAGELRLAEEVDFETQNQFTLDLIATDVDNQSVSNRFFVNISDENEPPVVSNPIEKVDKEASTNIELSVGGVFSDVDQGDELTLSLEVVGNSSLPPGVMFDANNDKIALNADLTLSTFKMVLTATDLGGLIARDTISVSAEIVIPLGLEINSEGFKIYPNPVENQLNLISNKFERMHINYATILDLSGRVMIENVAIVEGKMRVDELVKGAYLLELTNEGRLIHLRFIKK